MTQPRVLLLQARRADDPAAPAEVRSFLDKTGLAEESLDVHNLVEGPPTLRRVLGHDALMVGGSGEYFVSRRNLPGFDQLMELLREIAALGHPTFASCFGFQCMVEALGGEIVHLPEKMELGTYRLELTEAGRRDELFGRLAPSFDAQLGHKDRARRLPPGLVNLAASELCELQGFRLPGKPVWATQFHPEMTPEENLRRYLLYLNLYSHHLSEEEKAEALRRFRGSHDTIEMLPRFLELVFGWRARALPGGAEPNPPARRSGAEG